MNAVFVKVIELDYIFINKADIYPPKLLKVF